MPKCLECGKILPRLQWTHFRYQCTGRFKNGREYQEVFKNAQLVDLRIKKSTAVTLENFIKKYGENLGQEKWTNYREKQAYSNTFEYKKKKYGWTKNKWSKFNKSRAVTVENLVRKYGEVVGLEKWHQYCEKQKITKSKEYFVKKYGIEKWNELCIKKSQVHNPIFISQNEGITIEQALSKIAARRGAAYTSKLELDFIRMLEQKFGKLDHTTICKPFGRWDHENNQYVIYDIKHKNCIIEFNGDYWHANPKYYSEKDLIRNQTAAEIWKKDQHKREIAESFNLSVYTVWESDYLDNKNETITKVIEWIQNTLKLNQ
jgi:hypothetical protein